MAGTSTPGTTPPAEATASTPRTTADSTVRATVKADYLVCLNVPDHAFQCVKDLVLSNVTAIKICVTGNQYQDPPCKASMEQICDSTLPKYWNEEVALIRRDIHEDHSPACDADRNRPFAMCKLTPDFDWAFDDCPYGSRACLWYWARVEEAIVMSSLAEAYAEFPGHEWKEAFPTDKGADRRRFGPLRGKSSHLTLHSAKDLPDKGSAGSVRGLAHIERWLEYIVRQSPDTMQPNRQRDGRWHQTVQRFRSQRAPVERFPPITHVVSSMVMDHAFTDTVAESLFGRFKTCRVSFETVDRFHTFNAVNGLTVLFLACSVVSRPAADKLVAMPLSGGIIMSDILKQKDPGYVAGMCVLSPERVLTQIISQASIPDSGHVHGDFVTMREWTRLCFSHILVRFSLSFEDDFADWDGVSPFKVSRTLKSILCHTWAGLAYSKNKLLMVRQSGFLLGCALAAFVTRFQERYGADVRRNSNRKLWIALVADVTKIPVSAFSGPDLPTDSSVAIINDRLDRRLSKKEEAIQQALASAFDWLSSYLRMLLDKYTTDLIPHDDFTRHFVQAYGLCMGVDLPALDQLRGQSLFGDNNRCRLSDSLDSRYKDEDVHYRFALDLFCTPMHEAVAHRRDHNKRRP